MASELLFVNGTLMRGLALHANLDERFEGAFFEDDDYLERLREAGVPTVQITSVRVESSRTGLTMSKVPEQADAWYAANERRFAEKWGWTPPPVIWAS